MWAWLVLGFLFSHGPFCAFPLCVIVIVFEAVLELVLVVMYHGRLFADVCKPSSNRCTCRCGLMVIPVPPLL